MALGYDVYEDNRDFEQEGLTGNVKRYAVDKMQFPCYILVSDDKHSVPLYKIKVLKQMSSTFEIFDETEVDMAINIYYTENGKTVSICKIFPKQVKSFLKLFDTELIEGFLSKDKELVGNHLYVLSN